MPRNSCFLLLTILIAAACCSCDPLSTVRYSVAVGTDDLIDHKEVVQLDRKEQVARVYQTATDVALKYGLERCEGPQCATWNLSCKKFREKSCEQFAAPGGNVRGHGAPGLLIYKQDETHVMILIRYFVGPSEPFTNLGRDLDNKIKDQPGVSVTVNLQ